MKFIVGVFSLARKRGKRGCGWGQYALQMEVLL